MSKIENEPIRAALKRLCDLFALYNLEKDLATVLLDGYFTQFHAELLNKAVKDLLRAVRPDAVPLVDGFDHSDRTLASAIGRYDGNVYEAIYKSAQASQLNKKDVLDGYHEFIRPLLDLTKAFAKL